MVCPVTSTDNKFPLHVEIEQPICVNGYIMVEQIKSVDYQVRCVKFIEKAPEELVGEVLAKLYANLY